MATDSCFCFSSRGRTALGAIGAGALTRSLRWAARDPDPIVVTRRGEGGGFTFRASARHLPLLCPDLRLARRVSRSWRGHCGGAMLFAANGLIGCPVKASDGEAGTVDGFPVRRPDLARPVDARAMPSAWLAAARFWSGRRRIAPIVFPPKPAFPMLSFGEALTLNLNIARAEIESGQGSEAVEPVQHLGGVATLMGFRVHAQDGESVRSRLSLQTTRTGPFAISSSPRIHGCRESRRPRARRRDSHRLERPACRCERLASSGFTRRRPGTSRR